VTVSHQTRISCVDLGLESLSQQQEKLFSAPRLARHHLLNQVISNLKSQSPKHLPTQCISN